MISLTDADAKPLTLLTGILKVIGEPETPADAQIVITDNATGNLIGIFKPRKKDGKFSIILEPNIDYHIVYSALTFKQEEDLYVPEVSSFKEINRGIDLQDIIFGEKQNVIDYLKGFLEYKNLLSAGTKISLLDENDKLLESTTTDKNGFFKFNKLNPNDYYLVRLDDVDKNFIDDAKVYIVNEKGEKVMLAIKKSKNRRLFRALPTDELNKLALLNEKDNKDVNANNNNTNTVDIKNVLASYQEFFNYNVKELNASNAKYIELISKVVENVNSDKKVTIEIEASASKVPTKTFKSNDALAKNRGEEAKEAIINALKAKGINMDKVVFKKIKSLVQGPSYKGDFENKDVYEKYQYVIITVK